MEPGYLNIKNYIRENFTRCFLLPEIIQHFMDLTDTSAKELASKAYVSRQMVSYWLTGKHIPTHHQIFNISTALELDEHRGGCLYSARRIMKEVTELEIIFDEALEKGDMRTIYIIVEALRSMNEEIQGTVEELRCENNHS